MREPKFWSPFDPHVIRWRLAGPEREAHLQHRESGAAMTKALSSEG